MSHFVCKWIAVEGKRLLEAILSTNLCALQQIKFAGKTSSLLLIFDENMVSLAWSAQYSESVHEKRKFYWWHWSSCVCSVVHTVYSISNPIFQCQQIAHIQVGSTKGNSKYNSNCCWTFPQRMGSPSTFMLAVNRIQNLGYPLSWGPALVHTLDYVLLAGQCTAAVHFFWSGFLSKSRAPCSFTQVLQLKPLQQATIHLAALSNHSS